jgi:hypothetical protein
MREGSADRPACARATSPSSGGWSQDGVAEPDARGQVQVLCAGSCTDTVACVGCTAYSCHVRSSGNLVGTGLGCRLYSRNLLTDTVVLLCNVRSTVAAVWRTECTICSSQS